MKRLFIALNFPSDIVVKLTELQSGLRGARWVPPQNLHLTLSYIGEASNILLEDLEDMLSSLAAHAFCMQLRGINHFTSKGRSKSIWVGVAEEPSLFSLHSKVKNCLQINRIPRDKRQFSPHVTIARLKNVRPEDTAEFIAFNNLFKTRSFRIESFTLFESISKKEGSIYLPLEKFRLT